MHATILVIHRAFHSWRNFHYSINLVNLSQVCMSEQNVSHLILTDIEILYSFKCIFLTSACPVWMIASCCSLLLLSHWHFFLSLIWVRWKELSFQYGLMCSIDVHPFMWICRQLLPFAQQLISFTGKLSMHVAT